MYGLEIFKLPFWVLNGLKKHQNWMKIINRIALLLKDLTVLTERMTTEKVKKPVENLNDKKKTCYLYKKVKRSTDAWITINKMHRVYHFTQETWLQSYSNVNTELPY